MAPIVTGRDRLHQGAHIAGAVQFEKRPLVFANASALQRLRVAFGRFSVSISGCGSGLKLLHRLPRNTGGAKQLRIQRSASEEHLLQRGIHVIRRQ